MLLFAFVLWHHVRSNNTAGQTMEGKHEALSATWQTMPYVPIDDAKSIYQQLELAKVESDTNINPDQHAGFLNDATLLLTMYQTNSPVLILTKYLREREPVKFNGDPNVWRKLEQTNGMSGDDRPEIAVPKILALSHTHKEFSGLCGQTSTIRYFQVQKSTAPYHGLIELPEDVDKNLPGNVGYVWPNKLFEFPEDFKSQYDQDKPVKIAELDTYVKGEQTPKAERLLMRFVWCPGAKEWRPFDLAFDNDVPGTVLFLP